MAARPSAEASRLRRDRDQLFAEALARLRVGELHWPTPEEEARIIADHVVDAALCGYEYSGLPKILNVAEHRQLREPRRPMRAISRGAAPARHG